MAWVDYESSGGGITTIEEIYRPADTEPVMWVSRRKGWMAVENYASQSPIIDTPLAWKAGVSGGSVTAEGGVAGRSEGLNQRYHGLSTGGTSTGRAGLYTMGGTVSDFFDLSATDMDLEAYLRVRIPNLSDGTETFDFHFGLMNQITGSANADAIQFKYDTDTGVNWLCETIASSTKTSTDSGIAVAEDEWINLFWRYSEADANVKFYVNSVLAATNSTNIPTGTSPNMYMIWKMIKSAGTTSREVLGTAFQMAAYDAG